MNDVFREISLAAADDADVHELMASRRVYECEVQSVLPVSLL